MALNNDTIQHPLPGDLQQRVENALDQITMAEAEYSRLSRLAVNEREKINSQHIEKKDLESKISALLTDISEATKARDKGHTELDATLHEVADAKHDLEEVKRETEASLDVKIKIEKEIENLRKISLAEKSELEGRFKELREKEEAHNKKVSKLKEALN